MVYASITTFRVATGGTWTEAPGTRWFRFGTLKWTELATTGNILGLRVGRNDRDNNDNLPLLQRIRAGSRIQLSTGTRLIRGSVLATFAYPDADAPSGVDIEFEVRGKRDGGDRSDWPIDPQDAELCILDGPLKEELDRSTARLLKDSIGDNADVLREPIAGGARAGGPARHADPGAGVCAGRGGGADGDDGCALADADAASADQRQQRVCGMDGAFDCRGRRVHQGRSC